MSLKFCSLASGSSGNSYLIKSKTTALLIDAGISGKKIIEGITGAGTDPEDISAILVTHEHIDHVKSLRVLHKKLPEANTFSNIPTWECIKDRIPEGRHIAFESGGSFSIGDISINTFRTSHDAAEPVGYSLECEGSRIAVLTDTGFVTEEAYNEVKEADLLILEANHDPNVLRMCRYPYHVKRRILGDMGHLSNEAAAACIAKIQREVPKKRFVLLAHLSKENNSPELAVVTVKNHLQEEGIYPGDELKLGVLERDSKSFDFTL